MDNAGNTTGRVERNHKPNLTGVVLSDKGDKTIKVGVELRRPHERYGKYVRSQSRLLAHDETNDARQGDTVEISMCRPISKHKSWRLVKVIRRAPVLAPINRRADSDASQGEASGGTADTQA